MTKARSKFFSDMKKISPQMVELAFYIRAFRRINNLSQAEMAEICNEYGKKNNVKMHFTEISNYERYKVIPSEVKFQILLDTMKITREDLKR